jgi:Flp pilus assembly pilin Flp
MQLTTLKVFAASEEGAVTVDWVVLTAAVSALAIAAITSIHGSSGNVGNVVGGHLDSRVIGE